MEGALDKFSILCMILVSTHFLRSVFRYLYGYVIAPALNMNVDLKKMGQWAVITGATDGVGKAYAENLASRGTDIVLISRSKDKLESVAGEIRTTYKVNVKIIEADFSEGNQIYDRIEKELHNLEIGVLVNNVGMSYPHPEYFLELKGKENIFHNIVQCNIVSVLAMSQIVMPGMVERKKGVVINISSAIAEMPAPLLAVYSASKMFISKLSKDLAKEYKEHGIIVQCILPGLVATKMSKISRTSFWAPSPKTFVSSALKTVGIQSHTTGFISHEILAVAGNFIMNYISSDFVSWFIFSQMKTVRAIAIKKATRAASD